MKARFDILGLGCAAVDDLLYVNRYPRPDTKVHVNNRQRYCGGLTATALVSAARLGAKCVYAGVLGEDADSQFVLAALRREGVNIGHVKRRRGARPIRALVVVDLRGRTRTVLYEADGVIGADPEWPPVGIIRASRVLFVDRFGTPGMIRAARVAREAGIPVVGDFERAGTPRLRQLLPLVNHLVVSWEFARDTTGMRRPAQAVAGLLRKGQEVVVITCGEQGCWFLQAGQKKAVHRPAFRVKTADTTGCGDVFHGAYAAGLSARLPLEERLAWASAAAALKAQGPGGPDGIPTRARVERFLRDRGA